MVVIQTSLIISGMEIGIYLEALEVEEPKGHTYYRMHSLAVDAVY